jgi:FtsH-binding integral membrane protein
MKHDEELLTPQESLRVIRETIDLAKHNVRENGFHFLLWGWLVMLTCLASYFLALNDQPRADTLPWMIMMAIGIPAALIYERRRDKKRQPENMVRDWYGLIWLGFGISLFLVISLSVQARLSPIPFILVLVGFATFMSGILLRFRPLVVGAVVMWVAAAVCLAVPAQAHTLVQGVATGLGYLVPGYLLNRQARARHV